MLYRYRLQHRSRDTKQCCQKAEISAAKHKRGRQKLCGAWKIWGRILGRFAKKGRKGAGLLIELILLISIPTKHFVFQTALSCGGSQLISIPPIPEHVVQYSKLL
jgi:hypothetical protein